jgi:hypothetical protein
LKVKTAHSAAFLGAVTWTLVVAAPIQLTHGRRYLPVLSKDPRVLASIAKTIVVVSHREKLS